MSFLREVYAVIDCVEDAGHRELSMLLRVVVQTGGRFALVSAALRRSVKWLSSGAVLLENPLGFSHQIPAMGNEKILDFILEVSPAKQAEPIGGSEAVAESAFVFTDVDGLPFTPARAQSLIVSSFKSEKKRYQILAGVESPCKLVSSIRPDVNLDSLASEVVVNSDLSRWVCRKSGE